MVSYTSLEQLRAVSDIEDMYEILVANHPDNQQVYEEEDTD